MGVLGRRVEARQLRSAAAPCCPCTGMGARHAFSTDVMRSGRAKTGVMFAPSCRRLARGVMERGLGGLSTSGLGGRSTARIGVVQSSICSCLGRGHSVIGMPRRTDRFAMASVLVDRGADRRGVQRQGTRPLRISSHGSCCSASSRVSDRGRVLLMQPLLAELSQLGSALPPLVARRVAETLQPHAAAGLSPTSQLVDRPGQLSAGLAGTTGDGHISLDDAAFARYTFAEVSWPRCRGGRCIPGGRA